MRRLVLLLTAPGEIICDPYAGSGSTLVAAKQEGRRYVGVKQHKPYANTIETRLDSRCALAPNESSSRTAR